MKVAVVDRRTQAQVAVLRFRTPPAAGDLIDHDGVTWVVRSRKLGAPLIVYCDGPRS